MIVYYIYVTKKLIFLSTHSNDTVEPPDANSFEDLLLGKAADRNHDPVDRALRHRRRSAHHAGFGIQLQTESFEHQEARPRFGRSDDAELLEGRLELRPDRSRKQDFYDRQRR